MTRFAVLALLCLAVAAVSATVASAAAPVGSGAIEECFRGSHQQALDKKAIMDGLTFTSRTQKVGLEMRLLTYPWTSKPSLAFSAGRAPQPKGFTGLGLSSATIATIWARIHAQEAKMNLGQPAGWPCEPFTNPSLVIEFARQTLVYNGFHPNASFTVVNDRQITFDAVLDGVEYTGAVVKSGPRQIAMRANEVPTIGHSTGLGEIDRFSTSFDA